MSRTFGQKVAWVHFTFAKINQWNSAHWLAHFTKQARLKFIGLRVCYIFSKTNSIHKLKQHWNSIVFIGERRYNWNAPVHTLESHIPKMSIRGPQSMGNLECKTIISLIGYNCTTLLDTKWWWHFPFSFLHVTKQRPLNDNAETPRSFAI
jgi:hypothetical protein